MLNDLNGVAFMVDTMPAGLFVACAASAALTTHTLGRVLGWGGVVAGASAVIATAATGVHVENFVAVPFLFLFLWILLVSFRLGFRRTRGADEEADRSVELAV